jgi:hypothetical protein
VLKHTILFECLKLSALLRLIEGASPSKSISSPAILPINQDSSVLLRSCKRRSDFESGQIHYTISVLKSPVMSAASTIIPLGQFRFSYTDDPLQKMMLASYRSVHK